jgi:mRNA-decapping enzyme subunit 2
MSTYPNAGSSSRETPAWAQAGYQDDMEQADEETNAFRDMSFDDIMEDLIARFMVNLPREETTPVRLYWQAEQA